MEFRETLLAAQRNQQQQSSSSYYYKAKFDPPKKEQKQRDRLSANIQKFLAKKDEEEKQKKLEIERKRDELLAMRDPKLMRKIQKSLKVFKSANKSVLEDAVDHDNTAVTREGPDQPDQDDYGYESQEAAAIYEKMMQKYSKIPEVPKFPTGNNAVKKDLKGTMERVKHALQHEDDPVPHKRRRKGGTNDRDNSPPTKYEPDKEKKKEEQLKSEKPKIRKPVPPPMDFNQLLKLAEQKKSEPIEAAAKKALAEKETERPMTKKQKQEYEEELARKQRRQERLEADKGGSKKVREEKFIEKEKKPEPGGFGRIPKLGNKNSVNTRIDSPKVSDRDRQGIDRNRHGSEKVGHAGERERKQESRGETEKYSADKNKYVLTSLDREKISGDRNKHGGDRDRLQKERDRARLEKERVEREKLRIDKERLEKLQAERERIDRDIERLNRDREKLDKTNLRLETNIQPDRHNKSLEKTVERSKIVSKEQNLKKNIDLKSQNTYRIDKNSNERRLPISNKNNNGKYLNGDSSKQAPRTSKEQLQQRNGVKEREMLSKQKSLPANGSLKPNGKIEYRKPMESGKMPPKRPDEKSMQGKSHAGPSKPKVTSFDFDKHINSIGKNGRQDGSRKFPPGDVRRKANPDDAKKKPIRRLQSDSEYDSEMDDFIDDGDENMDYSTHIKEIFGYDKSKYRYMDDDDDPTMESSFARQQREEYISKKIGIMEDLEDMRMEAMEKKKPKKSRRISDD